MRYKTLKNKANTIALKQTLVYILLVAIILTIKCITSSEFQNNMNNAKLYKIMQNF